MKNIVNKLAGLFGQGKIASLEKLSTNQLEDEKIRLQGQNRGQGSALLLSAAEGVDAAVTQTSQVCSDQGILQQI